MPLFVPNTSLGTTVSKVAFVSRLTGAEYVAILTATKTDIVVEAYFNMFMMADRIDLTHPKTVEGAAVFVAKGLITQERMDEVLSAPVTQSELA